jgi:superfamily II DNA helicase RecQ
VFTSPDIALSEEFHKDVLQKPRFRHRLMCVVIDELHLVEEWKTFREDYGNLQLLRQRVPVKVPLLGVTANLPNSWMQKILISAGFRKDCFILREKFFREEFKLIIRPFHYAQNIFRDLAPILDLGGLIDLCKIPKTVIFMNFISKLKAV